MTTASPIPTKVRIGSHIVEVPNYVMKLESWEGVWIILYSFGDLEGEEFERNIWCFDDTTGERLWRVEASPHLRGLPGCWGMFYFKDGKLLAVNALDPTYVVNIKTGQITEFD